MPKEKQKTEIKVTDKRIFTSDGDIRDEFRQEITPAEPPVAAPPAEESKPPVAKDPASSLESAAEQADGRRTLADKGSNPGTPFTNFLESLIVQAYMSLGMLRNPYQPQVKPDAVAARQLIDILILLGEKTRGNLTAEESGYLDAHVSELKLAFVQRTKSI